MLCVAGHGLETRTATDGLGAAVTGPRWVDAGEGDRGLENEECRGLRRT